MLLQCELCIGRRTWQHSRHLRTRCSSLLRDICLCRNPPPRTRRIAHPRAILHLVRARKLLQPRTAGGRRRQRRCWRHLIRKAVYQRLWLCCAGVVCAAGAFLPTRSLFVFVAVLAWSADSNADGIVTQGRAGARGSAEMQVLCQA